MLGDRHYQPENFTELVNNLTSYEYATDFYMKIKDEAQDFDYYEPAFEIIEDSGTSHMSVIDQNGMACALTWVYNVIFQFILQLYPILFFDKNYPHIRLQL